MLENDFDRRDVLRATAWSLPVLAVAVAAPAVTASVVQPLVIFNADCTVAMANQNKGVGFDVTVGEPGLPAGTTIVIEGPGIDDPSVSWTWLPDNGQAENVVVEPGPIDGTVVLTVTGLIPAGSYSLGGRITGSGEGGTYRAIMSVPGGAANGSDLQAEIIVNRLTDQCEAFG